MLLLSGGRYFRDLMGGQKINVTFGSRYFRGGGGGGKALVSELYGSSAVSFNKKFLLIHIYEKHSIEYKKNTCKNKRKGVH